VWGTGDACDPNIDPACENIVWGTGGEDNIVWGTSADENVVWGVRPLEPVPTAESMR
jgi:hypothetical protein